MKTEGASIQSTAPEGGWGWWIVLAYSINNMVVISTLQVFGLLYKDLLHELRMSAVEISIIVTTNCSFGMLIAIINGPILRIFGFRKVAILGSLLIFVGNVMTSMSTTFIEFLIYFGIIVSIGTDLVMAAFHLALNTYFVSKRGIATGIAMSFTGIGPIFMPLITSGLLSLYGVFGAGLIIASLTLHSLVAALLLQPIKWHKKNLKDIEVKQDVTTPMNGEKKVIEQKEANDIDDISPDSKLIKDQIALNIEERVSVLVIDKELNEEEKRDPIKSLDDIVKRDNGIFSSMIRFFDLDLLRDPIYLNISGGLTISFVAEMSFSLMLPFILEDQGFVTTEIAIFMTLLAVADILSRFISPFVGERVKSRVRVVYLIGLTSGIVIRFFLIHSKGFVMMILIIFGLGVSKGIRSIYTALVIPGYVPLHKLASATGLQMVMNGILLLICGPLLGKIRDQSGNYNKWIYVINCFGLITVLLWCTEMIFLRNKKRKMKAKSPIVKKIER